MRKDKRIILTITIIITMILTIIAQNVKISRLEKEVSTTTNNTSNKLEIAYTTDKSTDKVYIEQGETYTELNNGTWWIKGEKTNTYIFQAVELGDWDITVNNKEQLQKVISTYLDYHNNLKK